MAITRPGRPQAGRDQIYRARPPGSGVQQEIDRALAAVYRVFAREYPRWAQSQFNERFLHSRVAPLLAAQAGPLGALTPEVVVQLWAGQRPWFNAHTRRAAMQALMPAAEEFLALLTAELAWLWSLPPLRAGCPGGKMACEPGLQPEQGEPGPF